MGAGLRRGLAYPADPAASWAANRRLMDPRQPFERQCNATLAPQASTAAFEALWLEVAAERARWQLEGSEAGAGAGTGAGHKEAGSSQSPPQDNPAVFLRGLEAAEAAAAVLFESLPPFACSNPQRCIGLVVNGSSSGDCICRR